MVAPTAGCGGSLESLVLKVFSHFIYLRGNFINVVLPVRHANKFYVALPPPPPRMKPDPLTVRPGHRIIFSLNTGMSVILK
jgi:hypothetical protein